MALFGKRSGSGKFGGSSKSRIAKVTRKDAQPEQTEKVARAVKDPLTHGPSPDPATNLVIADIVMRSGGELLRMGVERALLGQRYGDHKAKKVARGRTLKQTMIGAALGRIATRSVPGALLVGGGMLAKTLYDRSKSTIDAKVEGEAKIAKQARKGE